MRTIERTSRFKRDYKRESQGPDRGGHSGVQGRDHRGDEGSPPGQPPAVRQRRGAARRSACGRLNAPAGSSATTSGSPRVPTGAGTPEFRAETIEAMREARRGNLPQFASVEELLDDLHADD